MKENKCKYNHKGNALMGTFSCIDQADCPEKDCPEYGHFFKCYRESCRTSPLERID